MASPLAPQHCHPSKAPRGPAPVKRKDGTLGSDNHCITTNREAAGRGIEEASNALHRTQAILTQIKVVGAETPNLGPALSEAKHAFEQGIANFRSDSFVSAGEFAAASSELSRAAAIVLLRALRLRMAEEACAAPKGVHRPAAANLRPSQEDFASVGKRLSRMVWLFENGTLPAEVIEQSRKITAWSEQLFGEAGRLFRNGAWEDALELVQAADAAAHSAEHVCKMCYLKEC